MDQYGGQQGGGQGYGNYNAYGSQQQMQQQQPQQQQYYDAPSAKRSRPEGAQDVGGQQFGNDQAQQFDPSAMMGGGMGMGMGMGGGMGGMGMGGYGMNPYMMQGMMMPGMMMPGMMGMMGDGSGGLGGPNGDGEMNPHASSHGKICFDYLNFGKCKRADSGQICRFRHLAPNHPEAIADKIKSGKMDEVPGYAPPARAAANMSIGELNQHAEPNAKLCFDYLNMGRCRRMQEGRICRFRHINQDHPEAIADKIKSGKLPPEAAYGAPQQQQQQQPYGQGQQQEQQPQQQMYQAPTSAAGAAPYTNFPPGAVSSAPLGPPEEPPKGPVERSEPANGASSKPVAGEEKVGEKRPRAEVIPAEEQGQGGGGKTETAGGDTTKEGGAGGEEKAEVSTEEKKE